MELEEDVEVAATSEEDDEGWDEHASSDEGEGGGDNGDGDEDDEDDDDEDEDDDDEDEDDEGDDAAGGAVCVHHTTKQVPLPYDYVRCA